MSRLHNYLTDIEGKGVCYYYTGNLFTKLTCHYGLLIIIFFGAVSSVTAQSGVGFENGITMMSTIESKG